MPDLCPLCMSPITSHAVVAITEDAVIYNDVVDELGISPTIGLDLNIT